MALTEEQLKYRQTQVVADDYYMKYRWDYRKVAQNCTRWGSCRFVGARRMLSQRFSKICASSAYYYFDAYSLQGRMQNAFAMLEGRLDCDRAPGLIDIYNTCNMCGGCDVMCKSYCNEGESLRVVQETRARLVQEGYTLPAHVPLIESLRKQDNMMMQPKSERGKWADGLRAKDLATEQAAVCYHAGCRLSFDQALWPVARQAVTLLGDAGVDVGIMGKDESCCGGRAYEMGYQSELAKFAESNLQAWKNAGVRTVITSCSDCYFTFKRLYTSHGSQVEVLHIVEFLGRLIQDGKLKFNKSMPMAVTYHDPCHLGRRTDVYVPGKPIEGVFDPPREIIRTIPGVRLVEMERIREYAWCCGAGGGVIDAYPELNAFAAEERAEEAKATGAQAIITACPYCQRNLLDATRKTGSAMQVYDIVELVRQAI